ncbi:Cystatin domain-containing protein [Caenorhabditis elegans]|uniref:Cystatin domain-containing protein n=1 Tax=Caenorhabditis elegans TaxID=6239 RepID=G4SN18_CAEEL|nr:Cystatin domain-containing protein [Caenorhabditis elegans]CCD72770.1 Cystatin domain-containing protein [Caenorhabditis elegans]|eukprot:NP_001254018.1 Uncharacterized protein CELE_Y39F10C.3 [Caenorhabditis elegans]
MSLLTAPLTIGLLLFILHGSCDGSPVPIGFYSQVNNDRALYRPVGVKFKELIRDSALESKASRSSCGSFGNVNVVYVKTKNGFRVKQKHEYMINVYNRVGCAQLDCGPTFKPESTHRVCVFGRG